MRLNMRKSDDSTATAETMTKAIKDTVPKSGEYMEGKFWFERKGAIVTLGLTNVAIEELGEVEGVELPDEGEDFEKGEIVMTIEKTHGRIEVTAPATGVIEAVNRSVESEPGLVAEDPLEEGWLVKIEIQDPSDLKEYVGILE